MFDKYLQKQTNTMHMISIRDNREMMIAINTTGDISTTVSVLCVLVTNVVVTCAVDEQKHYQTLIMLLITLP